EGTRSTVLEGERTVEFEELRKDAVPTSDRACAVEPDATLRMSFAANKFRLSAPSRLSCANAPTHAFAANLVFGRTARRRPRCVGLGVPSLIGDTMLLLVVPGYVSCATIQASEHR